MSNTLQVAVTTANFLPLTAVSGAALRRVHDWSAREGFAPPELLITRAAVDGPPIELPWTSVHEVWNPRDRLLRELVRVVRRRPQSRGMTPYPMDSLLFADADVSERAMFTIASAARATTVVSELMSPVSGRRYPGPSACVQVHPDLGPHGQHLELEAVARTVEECDYGVVLDTYHVRRRVRRHPGGRTEIAPPLPGPGEPSLGGIAAVWRRLGTRVRLVHFQLATPAELASLLEQGEWPFALAELRDLLPALAERRLPIVLELNAGWIARGPASKLGLDGQPMRDAMLRLRDRLLEAAR